MSKLKSVNVYLESENFRTIEQKTIVYALSNESTVLGQPVEMRSDLHHNLSGASVYEDL